HLFVLENLFQPMRAVVRNLSTGVCQGGPQPGATCTRDDDCAPGTCSGALPIEVIIYLGTNPRVSGGEASCSPASAAPSSPTTRRSPPSRAERRRSSRYARRSTLPASRS